MNFLLAAAASAPPPRPSVSIHARPRDVPHLRPRDAGHHLLVRAQVHRREQLLRRRPRHHRVAERPRRRGRLHERGELPRHRGDDCLQGLRRLHVFRRLAGGVSHRAAGRRRTAAQRRQIHDGGRARLPPQPASRARDGRALHAHRFDLLHDRANGRRGRAGETAAPRRGLRMGRHRRRRADDCLCRLRRDAGDDLGANHQGHPAHERLALPEHSRAETL